MRFAILLACLTSVAFGQEFRLGAKVTDFPLTDSEGKTLRYSELKGQITAVIFTATRCPVSNAYVERMEQLYRDYTPKGVNILFVNANATESLQEVQQHRQRMRLPFPMYKDVDNKAADLFGASATPEAYVMDSKGTVRYHGAIDDSQNVARIKTRGLADALNAVLRGSEVMKPETKAFGCTIKRVRSKTN